MRVDAVEIDPVIQRLGKQDHPDKPYDDPRVFVHLNDGRNYLRSSNQQYDPIIYALVDSLVLHSSYSNIRLESFLFTKQAMDDVKKRLKPRRVRHVQLFPPGLDRLAPAELGARRLRLGPYYAGLFLSLIISALVPMEDFLGMDRTAQIAGAMFGGLAEYSSMLLGFQYLLFVAVALYLVSMAGWRMAGRRG